MVWTWQNAGCSLKNKFIACVFRYNCRHTVVPDQDLQDWNDSVTRLFIHSAVTLSLIQETMKNIEIYLRFHVSLHAVYFSGVSIEQPSSVMKKTRINETKANMSQ